MKSRGVSADDNDLDYTPLKSAKSAPTSPAQVTTSNLVITILKYNDICMAYLMLTRLMQTNQMIKLHQNQQQILKRRETQRTWCPLWFNWFFSKTGFVDTCFAVWLY